MKHGRKRGPEQPSTPSWQTNPTVGLSSRAQVFFLTREDFMGVVERRKVTCPQLAQIVRRYCVRIAVTRGIIAEARCGVGEAEG